ncbi:MAG: uncharacterized protein QG635_521 [Bacteroidota bacterium]|nr:uncharacterized protein [Bacteroidota bacterium]
MTIKIEKLDESQIKQQGIRSWPIWTKEASTFNWFYDSRERCLFLEGKVKVVTDDGEVEINAGDFATFPKGLKCVWHVLEPVRKHYNFD